MKIEFVQEEILRVPDWNATYILKPDLMSLADSMCETAGEARTCAEWEQRRLAGYSETAETAEADDSKLLDLTHWVDSD